MSQWHGRLWGFGINVVGSRTSTPWNNISLAWLGQSAGLGASNQQLNDARLVRYYLPNRPNTQNLAMSEFVGLAPTTFAYYSWAKTRYPYSDWWNVNKTLTLNSVTNIAVAIGYCGTGRASHRGGPNATIALKITWEGFPTQNDFIIETPDWYTISFNGRIDRAYTRPGGGSGNVTIEILTFHGSMNQHDVGDRGPGWEWHPLVWMGLNGSPMGNLPLNDGGGSGLYETFLTG